MNIKYGTVLLRAIEMTDMEFCREMINSGYIEGNTIGKSMPVSKQEQEKWFANYDKENEVRFIIEAGNQAVGMIMLTDIDWINRTGEASIKLNQNVVREKNCTSEASVAFLNYVFDELNMNCVYSKVLEGNLLSRKLLFSLGFVEEGILRQRIFKRGAYHNVIIYSLLQSEYWERKK